MFETNLLGNKAVYKEISSFSNSNFFDLYLKNDRLQGLEEILILIEINLFLFISWKRYIKFYFNFTSILFITFFIILIIFFQLVLVRSDYWSWVMSYVIISIRINPYPSQDRKPIEKVGIMSPSFPIIPYYRYFSGKSTVHNILLIELNQKW